MVHLDKASPNPQREWQTFDLSVFYAHLTAEITPPITLSYEHTGAVWVTLDTVRDFLEAPVTSDSWKQDPVFDQVLRDKIAPNMLYIFSLLARAI